MTPMITVRYATPEHPADLAEKIAALATRLTADHLGKKPDVRTVRCEMKETVKSAGPPKDWLAHRQTKVVR